ALDHTAELGETIEQVAAEKAGIFKSGLPAINGERDPAALAVLRRRAEEVGAPLTVLDEEAAIRGGGVGLEGTRLWLASPAWGERELRVGLIGERQARNAALAAHALGLLPDDLRPDWEAVARGLAAAKWTGSFQVERVRGTTWIFDVAHNAAGVEALVGTIAAVAPPRPVVLVAAILADKDWKAMLLALASVTDAVVLTIASSAPAGRRWDVDEAGEWLRRRTDLPVRV